MIKKMNIDTNQQIILLSTAIGDNKKTTYNFEITEINSPIELMYILNKKAVSVGLFRGGHRSSDNINACGNVYFIDIDIGQAAGKKPYYLEVEEKLKNMDISFVSVPSRSANQDTYKRHIAIILNRALPKSKKSFEATARYILNTIDIDESKIDQRVKFSPIAFLAPASINEKFTNADEVSNYNNGQPFFLSEELVCTITHKNIDFKNKVKSDGFIKFKDGSQVRIFEAKKLIEVGEKRSCFCPNPIHNDKNPSATLYHNIGGYIKIYCGKCGNISIDKNFMPLKPIINHYNYNYSIIVENATEDKISELYTALGQCAVKIKTTYIWYYKVGSIHHIYQLLLAKIWLVKNGFSISPFPTLQKPIHLNDTSTLIKIISNTILPKPFIPKNQQTSTHYYRYKQMAHLVFKHYLFAEAAIWTTYQNIINPNRSFNDTCDEGLSYFDFVIQKRKEENNFRLQKNKTFPMKLKGKAKDKLKKKQVENMKKGKDSKMIKLRKKIKQLCEDPCYQKVNGKQNITAISQKLQITRATVYSHIKLLP